MRAVGMLKGTSWTQAAAEVPPRGSVDFNDREPLRTALNGSPTVSDVAHGQDHFGYDLGGPSL